MAIIGRNDNTGTAQIPLSAGSALQRTMHRSYRWTATANQEVFRFGFEKGAINSTGEISFVLLDVTGISTTNPDGAPIVAGTEIAISSPFTLNSANTVELGSPVSVIEGNEYAVAFKISSGTVWPCR